MKADTDTRCSRHTALLPYICEPRFCPLYTSCSGDLTFQSTNLPNDHSISQFRKNFYFFCLNFVFLFILLSKFKFHVDRIVIGVGVACVDIFVRYAFYIIGNDKSVQCNCVGFTRYIFHVCITRAVP